MFVYSPTCPLIYDLKEDFVDLDTVKTEEIYAQMDDILDRLTPKNFHQSMKVVSAFTIDTEDKLKGFIDRIYKNAIKYPTYADVYAKVCHHHQLMGVSLHVKVFCLFLTV